MRMIVVFALFIAGVFGGGDARAEPAPSEILQTFMQRLKTVADQGNLFEPESVAKLLEMNFEISTDELTSDCAEIWQTRSNRTTRIAPDASSWYRNLPSGVHEMVVPQAFINPASKVGDADFKYQIVRKIGCTDQFNLQDHTEARLSFEGLSSFACILDADIWRLLPGAKFVMATDGVSFYVYQSKLDDEAATSLDFLFRMGAPCALSASIHKDPKSGLRYKRAESKWRNCEAHADIEFCKGRAPIEWADGQALDEMRNHANKACGTLDSVYKNDTERGTQPAPLPKYKQGGLPCERHDAS